MLESVESRLAATQQEENKRCTTHAMYTMANETGGCKIDRIARERELDNLDQRLLERRDAGASLSTSQSRLTRTSAC
jgi:hypothetical protein